MSIPLKFLIFLVFHWKEHLGATAFMINSQSLQFVFPFSIKKLNWYSSRLSLLNCQWSAIQTLNFPAVASLNTTTQYFLIFLILNPPQTLNFTFWALNFLSQHQCAFFELSIAVGAIIKLIAPEYYFFKKSLEFFISNLPYFNINDKFKYIFIM